MFYGALKARGFATGRKSGFTLYDTKKTAAGLLVDSGLTAEEAMAFSGHKTASMLERYIVRNADRHRASLEKRDRCLAERLAEKKADVAERVVDFPEQSEGS